MKKVIFAITSIFVIMVAVAFFLLHETPQDMYEMANRYYAGDGVQKDTVHAEILWKKAAEKGHTASQNALGEYYAKMQNYSQAVNWWQQSANSGDEISQYHMYECYLRGEGVILDSVAAMDWCTKSAEQGYPPAQNAIGSYLFKKKDFDEAIEWYQKAADNGNAMSQLNLGKCYYYGDGVALNYDKAASLFHKAAVQGNIVAQLCLGDCYHNGKGVVMDYEQAVYWYREAAKQGDAKACTTLGNCYYMGEGVAQDYKQAIEWYHKAAAQNYSPAQYNIAQCYYSGKGVEKDYGQANTWFKKTIDSEFSRMGMSPKDIPNKIEELTASRKKAISYVYGEACFQRGHLFQYYGNWMVAQYLERLSILYGHNGNEAKEIIILNFNDYAN